MHRRPRQHDDSLSNVDDWLGAQWPGPRYEERNANNIALMQRIISPTPTCRQSRQFHGPPFAQATRSGCQVGSVLSAQSYFPRSPKFSLAALSLRHNWIVAGTLQERDAGTQEPPRFHITLSPRPAVANCSPSLHLTYILTHARVTLTLRARRLPHTRCTRQSLFCRPPEPHFVLRCGIEMQFTFSFAALLALAVGATAQTTVPYVSPLRHLTARNQLRTHRIVASEY